MKRIALSLALLSLVALLPATAAPRAARSGSLGVTPRQSGDKYPMPPQFARRAPGKALSLWDEDVMLGAAWMEPSDSMEPDARLIFDDQESVDLFVAFLGSDTGGDVGVKIKLKGEGVHGTTKDSWRDYVDDDDVVLTRWWTFGVLPRGRYRVKLKVKDGTRYGRGDAEFYFEVLDLD